MLVNGRAIADKILENLDNLSSKRLCFVSFNQSAAGKSFVSLKVRVAESLGVVVEVVERSGATTAEAESLIKELSKKEFDGLVVQLPLDEGLDTEVVLNSIPLKLDIDLLSQAGKDAYKSGGTMRVPPVAGAVSEILREHGVVLEGKEVVVLGKGRLVGEPVQIMFEKLGVSYVALDKYTPYEELLEKIKSADVIVSGTGAPHFIKPQMIKPGVVLIDAGTSAESGRVVGDADPACEAVASLLTPVPGGVGPVTVAVLFSNLATQ